MSLVVFNKLISIYLFFCSHTKVIDHTSPIAVVTIETIKGGRIDFSAQTQMPFSYQMGRIALRLEYSGYASIIY